MKSDDVGLALFVLVVVLVVQAPPMSPSRLKLYCSGNMLNESGRPPPTNFFALSSQHS